MLTNKNEASWLRMSLTEAVARDAFNDRLEERIDRLPLEFRPKEKSSSRCCIYKDRAILRYRLMALLGHAVEKETDEAKPLADYISETRSNPAPSIEPLTILDIACSSCQGGTYKVTNLCKGCLARPCSSNCPKNALTMIDGRAIIDEEKCINCGKCKDVCPFNAIAYQTVPCEASCPVDAIAKDASGTARIDWDKCIRCGRCSRSCPFAAVMERSSLLPVVDLLKKGTAVAMVAPSVAGQYPGTIGQVNAALRKIGFSQVMEVAAGAELTVEHEAREFVEYRESGRYTMGTSCCPAYVQAVRRHIPDFEPLVSSTPTPMSYTGRQAAECFPGIPRVFIGPCVAKRSEALEDKSAEYVISFEELGALLLALGIEVENLEEEKADWEAGDRQVWAFASSGGVADNVARFLEAEGVEVPNVELVNGLDRKGLNRLRMAASGKGPEGLWEVMACEGGCLCGPSTIGNPRVSKRALDAVAISG